MSPSCDTGTGPFTTTIAQCVIVLALSAAMYAGLAYQRWMTSGSLRIGVHLRQDDADLTSVVGRDGVLVSNPMVAAQRDRAVTAGGDAVVVPVDADSSNSTTSPKSSSTSSGGSRVPRPRPSRPAMTWHAAAVVCASPVLLLLYPLVCTSTLDALRCVHLDGTYDHPLSRWVVASHPSLTCFGPEHRAAGGVAIVTLVVYVIGFPVVTLVYLLAHRSRASSGTVSDSEASKPRSNDSKGGPKSLTMINAGYRAGTLWFTHVHMALQFTLACTYVLLNDGLAWQQVVRLVLDGVAVAAVLALLVRARCSSGVSFDDVSRVCAHDRSVVVVALVDVQKDRCFLVCVLLLFFRSKCARIRTRLGGRSCRTGVASALCSLPTSRTQSFSSPTPPWTPTQRHPPARSTTWPPRLLVRRLTPAWRQPAAPRRR